ncbi:MAG TPA: EamA family transporter [Anaerolineaceae bacterium]|nr:EamA family transporter [Anaerolineaceae bacterium]
MNLSNQYRSRIYAIGTILLWSSAFVFTKIALEYFSPSSIGVLRYICASLFFIILVINKRIGLPTLKDIPFILVSGAMGFTLYMTFFNIGSGTLSPATASIIIATAPIITAVFSTLFFKEKIVTLGWVAIAIEFCGILVLTLWDGVFTINIGILWLLGSAICISAYNLMQRHLNKKYSALQATSYSIFAGTLLLLINLPHAAIQMAAAPLRQWLVILFLGVFPGGIAYLWWSNALSTAEKTSDVTNFMFVTPFLATLLGFLLIGEIPSLSTIVGGVIILAGLFLFQRVKSDSGTKIESA